MFVSMSPEQFEGLKEKLSNLSEEKNSEVLEFHPGTDLQGVIKTKDAYTDYAYDPSFQKLNINIGKCLSLAAKIAPHQVIENHIVEVLYALAIPVETVINQQLEPEENKSETLVNNSTKGIFKKAGE